jgi:hypothetical protein
MPCRANVPRPEPMQRYMSYVRSEKRCAAIVDRGMTWCVEGAGLFSAKHSGDRWGEFGVWVLTIT